MSDAPPPTLSDKRKEWLEALHGQDPNSIINQLLRMSWDFASFRVVNEARRLAPPAPEGGVKLNWLMHLLIDHGFFSAQIMAVRRLTDTYPLTGNRGVYSLTGLLTDLQDHSSLFTRTAMFDAEGLVYDYEPIGQQSLNTSTPQAAGAEAYGVLSELDSWREQRHKVVDVLADTTEDNRLPTDTIREIVFKNLLVKVQSASKGIIDHATKFIAHAAIPASRALVKADEASLTLANLWTAHEHLCQVAGFVSIYVLGDSCPRFLATPQFDVFEYIDRPLIDSSQIGQLQSLWDSFDNKCHASSQWGLAEYAKEFP